MQKKRRKRLSRMSEDIESKTKRREDKNCKQGEEDTRL